jgi:hypothetical protein
MSKILDQKDLGAKLKQVKDINELGVNLALIVDFLSDNKMLWNSNEGGIYIHFNKPLEDNYGITNNPKTKIDYIDITSATPGSSKDFSGVSCHAKKEFFRADSPERRIGFMRLLSDIIVRSLAGYEGLIDSKVLESARYIAENLNKSQE